MLQGPLVVSEGDQRKAAAKERPVSESGPQPEKEGVHNRPMTEDSGRREVGAHSDDPLQHPVRPEVVIRLRVHADNDADGMQKHDPPAQRHQYRVSSGIRSCTSVSSTILEPQFPFQPAPFPAHVASRPHTTAHGTSRSVLASSCGRRIHTSHSNAHQATHRIRPSQPPNSARASTTSSPRGLTMWSVGPGESMCMGVKKHNRDPVRVGLATPRRDESRTPIRTRTADPTISSRAKERKRDEPGEMAHDEYYSVMELDAQDIFQHFADQGRMDQGGLLAALDFMGVLPRTARNCVRGVLKSARRVTIAEALQLYDDIIECTAYSDDDVESSSDEDAASGAQASSGREGKIRKGQTVEQFEALLQVLDHRMSKRAADFLPYSAGVPASKSVHKLISKSPSHILSPRGETSYSPRYRQKSGRLHSGRKELPVMEGSEHNKVDGRLASKR